MPQADNDFSTHAPSEPDRSATFEGLQEAVSQARIISDVIELLGEATLNSTIAPSGAAYVWLATELDRRLELVEDAAWKLRAGGA